MQERRHDALQYDVRGNKVLSSTRVKYMKSSQFHIICAILWSITACVAHDEAVTFGAFCMFSMQFIAGLIYGIRGK